MKKQMKLTALVLSLVMLVCMAACTPANTESSSTNGNDTPSSSTPAASSTAAAQSNGVTGNTYVFTSYVSNGEEIDASEYMGGEKYFFETESTGTYAMAPMDGQSASFPFTYTISDGKISMRVDLGGDMINELEFVLEGDKIINTTSGPAFDMEGNPIEGETITDVVTYTKE